MDIFGIKALRKSNENLMLELKGALTLNNQLSHLSSMYNIASPTWGVFREVQAYQLFDDVYSVVSRLATSSAKIALEGYNEATDEDLPPTDNLQQYLTFLDFEQREILYTYLYLCGEVFMLKDRLSMGPNKGRLTTTFMHPSFCSLLYSNDFPQRVIGVKYTDTQFNFTIGIDDVIYIKYFNPSTVYMDRFRGMSPLKALAQRLTRLSANMSGTVAQMQNGGVPSIVYDKTPGIDESRPGGGASANNEVTVMGQHKDNFARFLRNADNKGAPYFTAGEMGVISLGLSLVDMDALTMADIDFDKICNAYSISSTLFNNKKSSTESNVKEMRKDMYTNAIIPNLTRVSDAIKKQTIDVFGTGKGIWPNLDDIEELQQDNKDKAAAWAALPAFIPNEMREAFDLDADTDPNADKLYIKTGYVLLDDLNIEVEPINNAANDYQGNNRAGNPAKP